MHPICGDRGSQASPHFRGFPCGRILGGSERPREEIRVKEVSFQYAADRPYALDCVNLRIPARATVGIVGANGSGKTTLMDVIAGLLVPTAGELRS